MEKRNTILLTVIAIATLLVAVVGATFAYFATTQNVDANVPVNVNTAKQAAAFTSSAVDQAINIVVDANEMQQADANDDTKEGLTDNATLLVQLKSAEDGKSSVCTYDIIFTWDSAKYAKPTGYVDPTAAAEPATSHYYRTTYTKAATEEGGSDTVEKIANEFTIEGTATLTGGTNTENLTTLPAITQKNFDEFTEAVRQVTDPENATNKIDKDYFVLVKGAAIESSSTSTLTEVTWTFNVKFYNSTHDQSLLMGKNFGGYISVDPTSIKC